VYEELGRLGMPAFLDTSDIEHGTEFPTRILDALMDANVFLIIADPIYYTRWYCVRELRIALAPYEQALRSHSDGGAQITATLDHIVVALPAHGSAGESLEQLPPVLRETNWPTVKQLDELIALIGSRASRGRRDLRSRYDEVGVHPSIASSYLHAASTPRAKSVTLSLVYPHSLPPSLGEEFVGRANELWLMDFALRTLRGSFESNVSRTVTLEATGGFGKTRLVLEYVCRFSDRFSGGVVWIEASSNLDNVEQQLHGVLKALQPRTPELPLFRQLGRDVRRELRDAVKGPLRAESLWVVNGVPEPSQGGLPERLDTYCPLIGIVSTVFTSRSRLIDPSIPSTPIQVRELDRRFAITLLSRSLPDIARYEKELASIADWVGGYPMALEILNSALRCQAVSVIELNEYASVTSTTEAIDELASMLERHVPAGLVRGVTGALKISYDLLDGDSQRLGCILASGSDDPIPVDLISTLMPRTQGWAARAMLTNRCFLQSGPSGDAAVIGRMHPVVADFLRGSSSSPATDAWALCNGLLALLEQDPARDPSQWALANAAVPHALALYPRLIQCCVTSNDWERTVDLQHRIGNAALVQGALSQAHRSFDEALRTATRELGPDHDGALAAMNNLAIVLGDEGDSWGALRLHRQVLAANRRIRGWHHIDTLKVWLNVAWTLKLLGRLHSAERMSLRALRSASARLGEDHELSLSAANNYAMILAANDNREDAEKVLRKVVQRSKKVLGAEALRTLTSVDNHGIVLRLLGRLKESEAYHRRVREARERILGQSHPDTLVTLGNLGATLCKGPNQREALSVLRDGLRRMRQSGSMHPVGGEMLKNVALLLADRSKLRGAVALLRRLVSLRERALGRNHVETLDAKWELAGVLRRSNRPNEASLLLESVVATHAVELGERHGLTCMSAFHLAELLMMQRDRLGVRRVFVKYLEWTLHVDRGTLRGYPLLVRNQLEKGGLPSAP
jgi:tetratricopeptide (TPR) repeat protein